MDLHALATQLRSAKAPEDVFGVLEGTAKKQEQLLHKSFRQLSRVAHPDRHELSHGDREVAHDAFAALNVLHETALLKIQQGLYGDKSAQPIRAGGAPILLKLGAKEIVLRDLLYAGDVSDLYAAEYTVNGSTQHVLAKVASQPRDNDLLQNEAKVLKAIYPPEQPEEKNYRYLPRLIDSFPLKGKAGVRQVNVLQRFDGWLTMEQIHARAPALDYRDVVWMFKRVLVAIGFAHVKGYVHGAVLPPHVLLHPFEHGGRLLDWKAAVPLGTRLTIASKSWSNFYAPEALAKAPVVPSTDIYMAAKCAIVLLGGNAITGELPTAVPDSLRRFLTSCLPANPRARPGDAWTLHEELDELLMKTVGKPSYRQLNV